MSELLFSFILGHFIADFFLQTDPVNEQKTHKDMKIRLKGLLIHISTHFFTYLIIIGLVNWWSSSVTLKFTELFIPILVILVFHFVIDIGKAEISNRFSSTKVKSWAFLIDQILHIATIVLILRVFGLISYEWPEILNFIERIFFKKTVSLSNLDKSMLVGSIVLVTTHFCGYFLDIVLKGFSPNERFIDAKKETKSQLMVDNTGKITTELTIEDVTVENAYNNSTIRVGKYIGMLERILIIILVATKSITGITFLVAIKALTRFKQFEDKSFAEYYLIGSLLSVLFGIVAGYITLQILS